MQYAIMSFDGSDGDRPEYPISAKTDNGARRQAKKEAARLGIKDYSIIFYRSSDGCRGWIDK
jgi:hypothetical protein